MSATGDSILILGLAREGLSLARYFHARGLRVVVTDRAPAEQLRGALAQLPSGVETLLGGDYPELVEQAGRFFVSPGVPENNPVYQAAHTAGLLVESMTTLFFSLCPAPIMGITGSSGKTTTTGLIGNILAAAGRRVVVGGNIGDPMLDLLPRIDAGTFVVLELSSFQLFLLRQSPHVAVVTNISPNHLDRHGTMDGYVAAKRNIVRHQQSGDYVVLNATDAWAGSFAAGAGRPSWFGLVLDGDGATVNGDQAGIRENGTFTPVIPLSSIPLIGRHNVENVLAALAASRAAGLAPVEMRAGIEAYRPPAHRLEPAGERDGVRYINDSIATSPARAMVALAAIDAPIVLIAGGRDKRLPWAEFARAVVDRVHGLVLIGEAADDIEAAVGVSLSEHPGALTAERIIRCATLEDAVEHAGTLARPGDVVLLSPACTSYDMFHDFAERGEAFVRAVGRVHAA